MLEERIEQLKKELKAAYEKLSITKCGEAYLASIRAKEQEVLSLIRQRKEIF